MYEFTEKMGEISGFGGGYESTCRQMLKNGLGFWDANPKLDPKYKGFKNVYGICIDDNEDAKKLDDAVMDGIEDATGAMHQAVVSTIFFIHKNGWDKYVEEMSKPKNAGK